MELTIRQELAYGERGAGARPSLRSALLVFEVELLEILYSAFCSLDQRGAGTSNNLQFVKMASFYAADPVCVFL